MVTCPPGPGCLLSSATAANGWPAARPAGRFTPLWVRRRPGAAVAVLDISTARHLRWAQGRPDVSVSQLIGYTVFLVADILGLRVIFTILRNR